jgi:hypothetical protein
MKKQMIRAIASVLCGLTVLITPVVHAQSEGNREIQTLWQGGDIRVVDVAAGTPTDVENVRTLFDRPECATDNLGHYVMGQLQGQQLFPIVDVPPKNIQSDPDQKTIHYWGTVQQAGPLQGAQVQGQFKLQGPKQIDAQVRIVLQQRIDITIAFPMQLVWQRGETVPTNPGTVKGGGATSPVDQSGSGTGKGG